MARQGGASRPGAQAASTLWAEKQASAARRAALGASYFDTKGDAQNLAYMVRAASAIFVCLFGEEL
jgi:hypothetical protein